MPPGATMEAAKPSSPLTTLSAVSTPESFVTAPSATPTNGNDTNISSPADLAQPLYRGARQLPYELCEHVKIFLEEHTCKTDRALAGVGKVHLVRKC